MKEQKTTEILTFGPGCPANGKNREGKCKIHEMGTYNFLSLRHSLTDQTKKGHNQGRRQLPVTPLNPSVGVLGSLGSWSC